MQSAIVDAAPTFTPFGEPDFLRQRIDWYYCERVEKTWQGGHIMRGLSPGEDSIRLMSNDYLAIANHPAIRQAQIDVLECSEQAVLMSAVFLHDETDPHMALEHEFAVFLESEATVLCQSGWCANTGLIQAIADQSTPVYVDMFAHMSLHEGVISAGAPVRSFRHNDVNHLEKLVRRHGPGVIVVDSVYSTSGDVAPLEDVVEVGERYDCVLVVDESHSLGTHGPHGAGMVVGAGLSERVHFRTASLAKAFAGRAGLITCTSRFAEYFKSTSRPAIFSSTLLPQEIAGLRETIRVIQREEWRRSQLRRSVRFLRRELDRLGYNVGEHETQIVPLEAGPEPETIVLRDALESRGVFGSVFCAPATPNKRALVRLSVNAGHSWSQLSRIVEVCAEIRKETGMARWPSTRRKHRRTVGPTAAAG